MGAVSTTAFFKIKDTNMALLHFGSSNYYVCTWQCLFMFSFLNMIFVYFVVQGVQGRES